MGSAATISARLDRLPSCRPLWGWVARLSFGAFFEIYETALTALLAPTLIAVGIFHKGRGGMFGLPDLATFAFATFFGLFVGAILFSALADKMGRRPIFTWSLLWYAAATLVMCGLSSAAWLCIWRFIASIGVGAEIVAIDSYLSELLPKRMRGRGFAVSKGLQYAAVPLAALFSTVLSQRVVFGVQGWRYLLVLPVVGAVLIWWVRRGLPESPRWLAEHGRVEEASSLLDALEARVERAQGITLDPVDMTADAEAPVPNGSFKDLFRGTLRARTWMIIVASCAQSVAYFGFGNWLPTLLQTNGVNVTKSLLYTAMINITYPLAPLAFFFFADRFERKWQLVAGAIVSVAAGLAFSRQHTAAGWIAFGLVVSIGFHLSSYALHTYRSELFPTAIRARAIGLVYSFDRITTAFNSYMIGFFLVTFGVRGVMLFICSASVVDILSVALFGPKTKGLSSEQVGTRACALNSGPVEDLV